MKFSSMCDSEAAFTQRLRNTVLPSGEKVRRIPFGLARGCRMEIDFATDSRLFLGLYELELNRAIRTLWGPGGKCFDIGAYNGYDSLALGNLGATEVVAFEVEDEAAATARRKFARRSAAADQIHGRGGLRVESERRRPGGDRRLRRAVRRPRLPQDRHRGAELSALEGMPKLLAARKPRAWLPEHGPLDHNRSLVVRGETAQPNLKTRSDCADRVELSLAYVTAN